MLAQGWTAVAAVKEGIGTDMDFVSLSLSPLFLPSGHRVIVKRGTALSQLLLSRFEGQCQLELSE